MTAAVVKWLRNTPGTWIAVVLFAAAVAVRLPAVFRELPPYLFCDEGIFLGDVRQQLNGGALGADDFRSGGVNIYPVVGLWRILSMLGVGAPSDTALVISGRLLLTVLLGAGAVIPIYLATRVISQRRAIGVVAGLAWIVSPYVLGVSRYWYPDHYAAFFSSWVLLFAVLILMRKPSWSYFVGLGAAWGLASATKYSGAFLGVTLLVVLLALWRRERNEAFVRTWPPAALMRRGAGAVGSAGFVFLVANWSLFRTPERFRADFMFNVENYSTSGDTTFMDGLPFNLFVALGLTAGLIGVVPYAVGYVTLWWRSRALFVLLSSFPVGLAVYLSTNSLIFHRNMSIAVPYLLPVLALGLAALWHVAVKRRRLWTLAAVALAAVIAQVAWSASASLSRDFHQDTRLQAEKWIQANIPSGATVGVNEFCSGPSAARATGRAVQVDPDMAGRYPFYALDSYWPSVLSAAYFRRGPFWWLSDQRDAHYYGTDDTSVTGRLGNPPVTALVPEGYRIVKTFRGSGPEIVILRRGKHQAP